LRELQCSIQSGDLAGRLELERRTHLELSQVRTSQLPEARLTSKEWIITNQLARRNLQTYQRIKLELKRSDIIKARAKEHQIEGGRTKVPQITGEAINPRENSTDRIIGKLAGVSHDTVYKVQFLEKNAPDEVKEALAQGKTTIGRRNSRNWAEGITYRKPLDKSQRLIRNLGNLSLNPHARGST
jgi:hypothetical protein